MINLEKYNTPAATEIDIIQRLKAGKPTMCIVYSGSQKRWELYQLSRDQTDNIYLQEYTAKSNCIWKTIPRGTKHTNTCINDMYRFMDDTSTMLFLTKSNNDNGLAIADFTKEQAAIGKEVPPDFLNLWKIVNNQACVVFTPG